MTAHKPTRRYAGQVLTYNFQADVFGGQYTLIENTGPSTWTAINLPPSEAEIAAILADPWCAKHGGADDLITSRFANWGRPFTVKFVSQAQWDKAF